MRTVSLIQSTNEVEIAGVYFTAVKEFGRNLGEVVDRAFVAKGAPEWFVVVRKARLDQKAPTYDDPYDPRFLLKEAVTPNSPVALAIPNFDEAWKSNAMNLRVRVNKWAHFSAAPSIANLLKVFEELHYASSRSNLEISHDLEVNILRMKDMLAGTWVDASPGPKQQSKMDEDVHSYVTQVEKKVLQIQARPPVGSIWKGSRGTRKIIIHKALRDVTENGVSIRDSLGVNSDEIVSKWLRHYPMGGEAKVAEDGAVMGFKKGVPYLIGWLEPSRVQANTVEGFYLDTEFEFLGNDVRDRQSGRLLTTVARESIDELIHVLEQKLEIGQIFNVTTYGQVVVETNLGVEMVVSEVHKDIWFPGQLAG